MDEQYRGYKIEIDWNVEGCGWVFSARKHLENEPDIMIENGLVYFSKEEAVNDCRNAIDVYEDSME